MCTRVPGSVLDAPKRGYTPPNGFVDQLIRRSGHISDGILDRSGWIDRSQLDGLISRHKAMPWLKSARVRERIGMYKSPWVLFRLLAFEQQYAHLVGPPRFEPMRSASALEM